MDQTVLTHGVNRVVDTTGEASMHVEELRLQGYTLVDSGLDERALDGLRNALEAVYRQQCDELGGEAALRRCNDADVARAPLVYDSRFVDVAANPNLLEVVSQVLGENFVLTQQNGLLNRPSAQHYQARWHRDLSYQHWVSSEPLAINALLALDEFSLSTGATYVLPASHLRPEFPSDAYVRRHQKVLEAPAGTFLVLDAMLFHRAGVNVSERPRRAVNHLIGRPFLAQQFDFPGMLQGRHAEDPLLARYLGYRWRPVSNVAEWRRQRMSAA
jgi:ectoine hydroxylase-related dioxygenase (phytanoyl-CoA dioxygenase family)